MESHALPWTGEVVDQLGFGSALRYLWRINPSKLGWPTLVFSGLLIETIGRYGFYGSLGSPLRLSPARILNDLSFLEKDAGPQSLGDRYRKGLRAFWCSMTNPEELKFVLRTYLR